MHEMSIAASLLDIVKQEMAKHNATKLIKIKVKYGRLANVVPEALDFAFEAMTTGTEFDGAELEMEEVPLVVSCISCKYEFTPEDDHLLIMPCPKCGEDFGHKVISGKELYLETLEAE